MRSLAARTRSGLRALGRIKVAAAAASKYQIQKRSLGLRQQNCAYGSSWAAFIVILPCLFRRRQQDCVYDSVLARLVCDLCISEIRLDDCALRDYVSSHVVKIGFIVLHSFDLYNLGLAGLGIGDDCSIAAEYLHLAVSSEGLYLLGPDVPNRRIALLSAGLELLLAPGQDQPSASELSS
jgi:hypothetical protein